MNRITAAAETLMAQGSMTAHEYLIEGIKRIDQEMGKGYAKKNPVLLAGFIQAASLDCSAATMAAQIRDGLEEMSGPSYGFTEIAEAIDKVTTALDDLPVGN